jgi:hypothetical protein
LLPGETATYANYTNYSRGINGISVDIASLPAEDGLGAWDFRFRVGSEEDPDQWSKAPAPIAMTVRPGDGVDSSDRVTFVWNAGAIRNEWLQVTVLATSNTGLGREEVFYFGNAVGDSGDSTSDARVNARDMLAARNNPHGLLKPAQVDCQWDFNHDTKVDAADMLIARGSQTHLLNALPLITAPGEKTPTSLLSDDGSSSTPPQWYDVVGEAPLASAHDALPLESVAGSPVGETASARMKWLYGFERGSCLERNPQQGSPDKRAVDEVLVTFLS